MTDVISAAGAVVWRPTAGDPPGFEVLLVHRPKYDDWSLAKGKCEPGEHAVLAAAREVFEETSVRSALGPRLPQVEYKTGAFRKRIDYWAMLSSGHQAAASHEVDEVSWLPLAQARVRLSYPSDVAVIDGLMPRETVPLILLRHASAGDKAHWPGDDQSRPLDVKGLKDALVLARLLACFAPSARVLSSPAVRCTESVRPYVASFGGAVEAEAGLALSGRSRHFSSRTRRADSLGALVRGLVAQRRPAVLCLHGENLPKALAVARTALGAPPSTGSKHPPLPKGGFWVVHMAEQEMAALDRYALLASGSACGSRASGCGPA
jgi:8-oxo-(d)GTP phosphatase